VTFSIDTLAAADRWPQTKVLALPGRLRGDLLGPWGDNLCKRYGANAVDRIRGRLPAPLTAISPVLTAKDWLPVFAQVLVTEAIVDEFLAGDWRALYPLLVADTRASLSRVHLLLARSIGVARAFKQATNNFAKVYDRGTASIELSKRHAWMTFAGHPVFACPSWRLLQLFALRLFLDLSGTAGDASGEDAGPDGFVAHATWS
jgi:hypothetical protein